MRTQPEIEADLDTIARGAPFWVDASYRIWADVPDLLAALEQARSIAVRLEQEVAANEPAF
jgi:hypothetical protein